MIHGFKEVRDLSAEEIDKCLRCYNKNDSTTCFSRGVQIRAKCVDCDLKSLMLHYL